MRSKEQAMKSIKRPAIFLPQLAASEPVSDNFGAIFSRAASLGCKGEQIPARDVRLNDLDTPAESVGDCQGLIGAAALRGAEISRIAREEPGVVNKALGLRS